jgi:hypothetical protein
MNENKSLKKQLDEKNETNNTGKLMVLTAENTRLKTDIIRIIKKLKSSEKKILDKKNEIEETTTEIDDDQETEELPNMKEIENCGVYIRPSKIKNSTFCAVFQIFVGQFYEHLNPHNRIQMFICITIVSALPRIRKANIIFKGKYMINYLERDRMYGTEQHIKLWDV